MPKPRMSWVVALALLVGVAAPVAAQDDMKYVGVTQQDFVPLLDGLFEPHRACWEQYRGVWCTTEMVLQGGPHPLAVDPPEAGAWIIPIVTSMEHGTNEQAQQTLSLTDISGLTLTSVPSIVGPTMNCGTWSSFNGTAHTVLINQPFFGQSKIRIAARSCSEELVAACCARKLAPGNIASPRQGGTD